MSRLPHVVALGCGTGLAQLLRGFKSRAVRVTGIVGVTDNGGHSGELRRALGIPAVGDLRSCLHALAPEGSPLERVLAHRVLAGPRSGQSLGNLMLAGALRKTSTLTRAALEVSAAWPRRLRALPVSDAAADVCARFADGAVVRGEWQILGRRPRGRIVSVFHRPALPASRRAVSAVYDADLVVVAPGALMTGIGSCLAAKGLARALRATFAPKVAVLNLVTQPGQTGGLSAAGHVAFLRENLGIPLDAVVLNSKPVPAAALREHADPGAKNLVDDLGAGEGYKVWRADLWERPDRAKVRAYARGGAGRVRKHVIRHDPSALAAFLLRKTAQKNARTSPNPR